MIQWDGDGFQPCMCKKNVSVYIIWWFPGMGVPKTMGVNTTVGVNTFSGPILDDLGRPHFRKPPYIQPHMMNIYRESPHDQSNVDSTLVQYNAIQ